MHERPLSTLEHAGPQQQGEHRKLDRNKFMMAVTDERIKQRIFTYLVGRTTFPVLHLEQNKSTIWINTRISWYYFCVCDHNVRILKYTRGGSCEHKYVPRSANGSLHDRSKDSTHVWYCLGVFDLTFPQRVRGLRRAGSVDEEPTRLHRALDICTRNVTFCCTCIL